MASSCHAPTPPAQSRLIGARNFCGPLCRDCIFAGCRRLNRLPGADSGARDQRECHGGGGGECEFIPLPCFLDLVSQTGRAGDDRLVGEVTLDVGGQSAGGFVAARAVLLEGTSSRSSRGRPPVR